LLFLLSSALRDALFTRWECVYIAVVDYKSLLYHYIKVPDVAFLSPWHGLPVTHTHLLYRNLLSPFSIAFWNKSYIYMFWYPYSHGAMTCFF
jgi:hypothetical protein